MTYLWDEKPEIKMDRFRDGKATHRFYDAEEMDAWLEKLRKFYHDWIADQKTELDEPKENAENFELYYCSECSERDTCTIHPSKYLYECPRYQSSEVKTQ